MARKPDTLGPVTKVDPSDQRIAKLEEKVNFLWDMVTFLHNHPNYKVGDYIVERERELEKLGMGAR
jgi:hypothetical protein